MRSFLLFALAVSVPGQTLLTEDAAVDHALRNDGAVASQSLALSAAKAAPRGTGLLPGAVIKFGMTDFAAELNDPERTRNNIGIQWAPPRPGAIGLRSALARTEEDQAAGSLDAARGRAAAEVRLIHRVAVVLDEQLRIAGEIAALREAIMADLDEQVAAGVKTRLDLSAAEIAHAEARAAEDQLRSQRRLHIVQLARRTGLDSATLNVAPPAGAFEFRPDILEIAELRRKAAERRPELRMADARCAARSLEVSSLRHELYPWIASAQLFRRMSRVIDQGSWGFQVNVDVPVFRWLDNGLPAARTALDQCRSERRTAETAIAAEVEELVARLEGVSADLSRYSSTLAPLAARHVEIADAALASGQADRVEPKLARLRTLELRRTYLTQLAEYRALEARLRQAVGDS